MNFDEIIERRGTHSAKWDMMEKSYGVAAADGIAMWVADMDFRPPQVVLDALQGMVDHGVFGYFGDDRAYKAAITWWMETRHGWSVAPEWIFTTHGLVNGTAMCVEAYSRPGDAVVLFTPVYHAFARVIKAAGRSVTELPMVVRDGRYSLDFDAYESRLTGRETMLVFCSPHNPGGRVWTSAELAQVAAFAQKHDLVLVSDEIHHDLVMPGQNHTVMARAAPEALDRMVVMTATTKTFNIAGCHSGNVIIPDPALRETFAARMAGLGISANSFGLVMATAAYSPEGAAWVDALTGYLDDNRKLFDEGVNAIPGLSSMPLEATYLAWVDFAGTGMEIPEVVARVERDARIAANHGPTFGAGGESFMRFNLATPRSRVVEAVERLHAAFKDLQ
ncbi:aminotransferase [Defluviimonas sp. 20V17]|uniref:cysteine-S-conjugate beta-lyase n=1 Tax=Allgaiera indica TaxID=765699 RepID=A0AAN5A1G7_9RHOB|nr:MalY/PatB family protein [Allgaiera indica]KDB04909.1 aminotransferase [Defluviimonas sp. 20V17]GHE05629.1 aminotransferase [Allgaiera indica]SDX78085.1 cystathione beta-lyase [Allgaiera indica]